MPSINNRFLSKKKLDWLLDLIFITLLFSFTLFKTFIFEFNTNEKEICFIFILSFWAILKLFYTKLESTKITGYDICFLLLFLYLVTHLYFYSETTYYYIKYWVYFNGFFTFFFFRWVLLSENKRQFKFHFILLLIVLNAFIQSVIALLQRLDYLKVENNYFKLLGSFSSPNYLGGYLGFGVIIILWYFFVFKLRNKWSFFIGLICVVILTFVIIISESRGTWIALAGSISSLIVTSEKSMKTIKEFSSIKKGITLVSIIILIFIGSKFIYSLNKDSANGRLLTAKITLQEITKKPLLGHGLFSFAGGYNKAKSDYFISKERPWKEIKVSNYIYTAFNDYLLISYELGVLFLLILLALGFSIILKSKINSETRLGIAILINLSIWILFNSMLGTVPFLLIGIFGLSLLFIYGELNMGFLKINLRLKNIIVLTIIIFSTLSIYIISTNVYELNKFKHYYTQNKNSIEKEKLMSFSKYLENNRTNNFQLGKTLYGLGHIEEGYALMEKEFKKTMLPKIGKQLAGFYLKDGNYYRAKAIYKLNIGLEPFRYEPRMNLISLEKKHNNYKEVVQLSKSIIDFPIKIPSEKIDDYKALSKKRIKRYSKYVDSNSSIKGTLSKPISIKSKLLNKNLLYKIYLPPITSLTKKLPVIYINDGRSYLEKGETVKILDSLIKNNSIKPVIAVFLEPKDGKQKWKNVRQELFLCNPVFVDFFVNEFIPNIEHNYPVSNLKKDRTIMGMSFGGLAAAYIARKSPSTFKNIVMQSPAFHPCKKIYNSYQNLPKENFNMYMSYGTGKDTEKQDLSMIKILEEKKYKLKIERVEGGNHTWDIWKEQLDDILIYFHEKL